MADAQQSDEMKNGWDADGMRRFFDQFPFFQLLGMRLVEIEAGRSVIELPFRGDLVQPAGVMHGGVIASLVDTGMAHAILLTDAYQELSHRGGSIVSLDLRIKYFRPVNSGGVTATSTVLRPGQRVMHTDSVVVNDAGKEIARADAIFMAVEGSQLRTRGTS